MLENFQFSQASLQDYADCPRRFQFRYLSGLSWPSVEAEPIDEYDRQMREGTIFHRMIQQHILGIPQEKLSAMAGGVELSVWWNNYRKSDFYELKAERYPEITLTGRIKGWPIIAKYDLIYVSDGRAKIIDWKTSRKCPQRDWLARRLQTIVYPCLLTEGGHHINKGKNFKPEDISMIYWFANFPDNTESFSYDSSRYRDDRSYLEELIEKILTDSEFIRTSEEHFCSYCIYRSLCNRGIEAGNIEKIEDEGDLRENINIDIDFEQITEIEW